jgi:hypothetical protein
VTATPSYQTQFQSAIWQFFEFGKPTTQIANASNPQLATYYIASALKVIDPFLD